MPTTAERHALVFLAAVALVGGGVRLVGVRRFEREVAQATSLDGGAVSADRGRDQLAAQIEAVDSVRLLAAGKRSGRRRAGPKTSGAAPRSSARHQLPTLQSESTTPSANNPLNVNTASAEDLERLPRVGPALAQRILAHRDSLGPFGSMDDLRHVRGIGVVTAALLAPLVTFDSWHRPLQNGSQRRPDESVPPSIMSTADSPWLHRQ